VASEMLSARLRRTLHLCIARWLEARGRGRAGAALLALHHERGGALARAAAEYARAGAHAAALGENAEALRHLERARQIHEESEWATRDDAMASSERPFDGLSSERRVARWDERVRLRLDLGDVLRRVGRTDEAAGVYEAARARILRRERREGTGFAPESAITWEAQVDHRLAQVHRLRGETTEALALAERALGHATRAGAVRDMPPMYALLVFLYRRARRPDACFHASLDGLRACRAIKHRDERWREDVVQLLFAIGTALYNRRRWVGAERSYRQALRALDEAKHPHLMGVALNGIAGARHNRGDFDSARDLLVRSLKLKDRVGDLHQIAVACNNLAEVSLRLRDAPAALEYARRSVRLGEQTHAGSDLADFYRNLAEAALAGGALDAALDAGLRALGIAETRGPLYLGDVAVTLANLCARIAEQSPGGGELRARAAEAARRLESSFTKYFNDEELRRKADECRALLAHTLLEHAPMTE
jgi:tetratricopeptide (TPR) repeat protein